MGIPLLGLRIFQMSEHPFSLPYWETQTFFFLFFLLSYRAAHWWWYLALLWAERKSEEKKGILYVIPVLDQKFIVIHITSIF